MQSMEEDEKDKGIKRVFINAQKIKEGGAPWDYEEGCLSIPNIRGDVSRPAVLRLRYLDENFEEHEELKPIKKKLVKRKLDKIAKGKADATYRLKFR